MMKMKWMAGVMASIMLTTPAQGALLDLTDRSVFNGGPSSGVWINNIDGTGINAFIESERGRMNTRERGPSTASCPTNPALACQSDGVGVRDDEITLRRGESVTLTFNETVALTAVYFLDMFTRMPNATERRFFEGAQTSFWARDGQNGFVQTSVMETFANAANGTGFVSDTLSQPTRVDRLVFRATAGRDDGSADFALAGLSFDAENSLTSSVPVPAALPLFLAGAAGLAAMRRRRST